jgi:mannose-6-phosphate isomerase
MKSEIFGGNLVKRVELGGFGKTILGSGSYQYFIYETKENEALYFKELRSFSVFVFDKPEAAMITVQGLDESPQQGDCVQAEDCGVQMNIKGGQVKLLVAGTALPHPTLKGLAITKQADIYKVEKPWGYELWANGQHPCYALKCIFIKAGTKTSLQYHNLKQETNVLFQGSAKLHYKHNDVPNDLVTPIDITTVMLEPVSSVDVVPLTLHRIEAVSDILLFETSTPHLDDVIRIQDDSVRPNGRLASEHKRL